MVALAAADAEMGGGLTMARIIDFQKETIKRFTEWAKGYVKFPEDYLTEDGCLIYVQVIIEFLVENRVFSVEEMRKELDERKISLHEQYFMTAERISP